MLQYYWLQWTAHGVQFGKLLIKLMEVRKLSNYNRLDNRTVEFTIVRTPGSPDGFFLTNDQLQATGKEPLILTLSHDALFSYQQGGPFQTLPAGTYLYEVEHPFAGDFVMMKPAGGTAPEAKFSVGTAIAGGR